MADTPQQSGKEEVNDERVRRLAALSSLSQRREQSSDTVASARGSNEHGGQRRRPRFMLGVGLLLVAGVTASTACYLAMRPRPHRSTPPVKVSLSPVADGLNCDRDIAWSPDGARIAVLGYKYDFQAQGQCPEDNPSSYLYEPGMIHIYDAVSKKLVVELHPDDIISAALHLPAVDAATPMAGTRLSSPESKVITYSHVLWSPDGAQLAITFFASLPGPSGAWDSAVEGVLLVHPDGSGARVLSHSAQSGVYPTWVAWNVATGTPTELSQSGTPAADQRNSVVPALNYTWDPNGNLTSQTPILDGAAPVQPPSLAPIGNPAGNPSFTTWQPMTLGAVTYLTPKDNRPVVISGVYSTRADYVAWSPDDQSLAIIEWAGLFAPNGFPTLTHQQAQTLDFGVYPQPPIRDKALVAALGMVSQDPNHLIPVSIAWKPDGRQLAVTSVNLDPDGSIVPASYRVLLFDCATGTKLAALTPDIVSETVHDNNGTYLRWSPDGKRLLLADGGLGTITVWSGSTLP